MSITVGIAGVEKDSMSNLGVDDWSDKHGLHAYMESMSVRMRPAGSS